MLLGLVRRALLIDHVELLVHGAVRPPAVDTRRLLVVARGARLLLAWRLVLGDQGRLVLVEPLDVG
jgi:hypothetical protein